MKESLGELVGGYRQAPHASYSLNAFIIDEKICFEEEYNYYPQGDDEGREYVYGLTIPLSHLDAFLALLLKRCGSKQSLDQLNNRKFLAWQLKTNKKKLLAKCLKQLVSQGEFKDANTAAIKENLMIVHGWLEEVGIPHREPFLTY